VEEERRGLQNQIIQLTETIASARSIDITQESELQRDSKMMLMKLAQAEKLQANLQQENETLQGLLQEQRTQVQELSQQLNSLSVQRASPDADDGSGEEYAAFLKRQLSEQMNRSKDLDAKVKYLTKENERLNSSKFNVELLKEEKRALEHKLELMDALRLRSSALEVEIASAKQERLEWARYLENHPDEDLKSPVEVVRQLAQARTECQALKSHVQQLQATLLQRDEAIQQRDSEVCRRTRDTGKMIFVRWTNYELRWATV
jgi:mitotic spindle assembly checkpoint protein MAD1